MKSGKRLAFLLGVCKGLALFLFAFGLVTQNRALQLAMVAAALLLFLVDVIRDLNEKKKLKNNDQQD